MTADKDTRREVYEYCTLRYVPDIEREEFVNVGLLMMCKRLRWMRCGLNVDSSRLAHLAPGADLGRLRVQLGVFERTDVPVSDLPVEERYRWMAAVKSAVIQTSASRAGILILPADASRMEAEERLSEKFAELFSRLVGSPE